jgi:hypothetical protein
MYRLLCMSATPNSSISLKRAFYFTATVDGGSFQSKLVYTVVHITVTCNTERFLYSKAIWRVAHSVMPLGGGGSDLCCRLWRQDAGEGNMGAQVDVISIKKIF